MSGGRWSFRIYVTYTNPNHFYYPRPYHYRTYCGGHYRTHYQNVSYYRGRHNHPTYNGSFRIRDNKSYHTSRRSDFGSVNIRPNSGTRPRVEQSNRRPAANGPTRRSDAGKEVNAPKREQSTQKESVRRGSSKGRWRAIAVHAEAAVLLPLLRVRHVLLPVRRKKVMECQDEIKLLSVWLN